MFLNFMSSIFLFRHMTLDTEIQKLNPRFMVSILNLPPIGKNRKQEVNFCISVFCNRHPNSHYFIPHRSHSQHAPMHSAVGRGSFPARECTCLFTRLRAKVVAFARTRPVALQGVLRGTCGRELVFDKIALCSQRVG